MWAGRYVCGSSVAGCGGKNESHYGHGLVAVSDDGVHFEDHSAFNAEVGNVVWDKCMVHKLKELDADGRPVFVMDHGTSGAVSGAYPRLLSIRSRSRDPSVVSHAKLAGGRGVLSGDASLALALPLSAGPDDPHAALPNDRGCPAGTAQCLRFPGLRMLPGAGHSRGGPAAAGSAMWGAAPRSRCFTPRFWSDAAAGPPNNACKRIRKTQALSQIQRRAQLGVHVHAWAPEFGGRKWVLRVRDWPSQNGVFGFWLKRHSICTPHFNRKYELIFSGGGKTILPPNSGAQACTCTPN